MVDLEAASIADVREFHETYYVPENATVVIVGDFDAAQTLSMVNQYFARAEGKRPGTEGFAEGAAADEGTPRRHRRNVAVARCRRGAITRTTGTRMRIRCTLPRRSCRMGRARVFRASWSTTSGLR